MSCCWEIMKTFICWIIAPLYHWIELGLFTLWSNWLTGEKAGRRDPDTNTISKLLCREDHFYGNYSFCFFKFHLFFFFRFIWSFSQCSVLFFFFFYNALRVSSREQIFWVLFVLMNIRFSQPFHLFLFCLPCLSHAEFFTVIQLC